MSGELSSARGFFILARYLTKNMSIKSTIAAVAASPFLLAGAAFAGPYVNVESNISYPDGDYSGATTDLHIGYEGDASEKVSFYVQGGPAFTAVDGTDGSEGELSGKAGINIAATDEKIVSAKCHHESMPINSSWVLKMNMNGKMAVRIS